MITISHIPNDIPLDLYLKRLMRAGELPKFYLTVEWKDLRLKVLEDNHYECARCKAKGKIVPADCVHHVNEVRARPDLALSRTFIDNKGNERAQLVPLCNKCHNEVHEKLKKFKRKDMFTNKERW